MKITKPLVKDNCKDCVANCEHAGKDREFICIGGVSCKKIKQGFDINKVKISWDFSMGDCPALLIAYVDNDKTYILKSCTSGTGMVDTKELEKLWEIATDPQAIRNLFVYPKKDVSAMDLTWQENGEIRSKFYQNEGW